MSEATVGGHRGVVRGGFRRRSRGSGPNMGDLRLSETTQAPEHVASGSRSWKSAGVTVIITGRPSVSSVICRLRPLRGSGLCAYGSGGGAGTDVADHAGPAPPPEEPQTVSPGGNPQTEPSTSRRCPRCSGCRRRSPAAAAGLPGWSGLRHSRLVMMTRAAGGLRAVRAERLCVRMGVRVLGAIRLTSPSGFRHWPSP